MSAHVQDSDAAADQPNDRANPALDSARQLDVCGEAQVPVEAADAPDASDIERGLIDACAGRLTDLRWFRTEWQHGGALTGYASYHEARDFDVVVKAPVSDNELIWLKRVADFADVVPHLFAAGDTLASQRLAWVVMERLPYGPLSTVWQGKEFDLLIDVVCRFYAASVHFPVQGPIVERDWSDELEQSRRNVSRGKLANESRWSKALKAAQKKLAGWCETWDKRSTDQWCLGDLHLGNAMTRTPAPSGPALLVDLGLVRRGHWIEDALYLEHLYWARSSDLKGRRLCRQVAHQRKAVGLNLEERWADAADAYRALLAMSMLASNPTRHSRKHLEATLLHLEQAVA